MSGFEDREKDFENKFAYDEKMGFNVEARCSKLFGLWASGKLGLSGPDAEAYAMTVVSANLEEAGFDDVLRKVAADFKKENIDISDHIMKVELNKALEEAQRQVKKG